MAARCRRRPDAVLEVAGVGLGLGFWALIALTIAGVAAIATIRVPRTIEAARVPNPALQCRADGGELAVAFEPHVVAMVPLQGTVELLTPTGATSVAVRTPGTDPTRRCLQLGPDHGRDTMAPTVLVRVRGGTALDFVFGGRR